MTEQNIILKVLVGSRGHQMARPDSDYDYRCVFVAPTRDILSLSNAGQKTLWQEGETKLEDDLTGWEIGHFLKLATKCNPTILEVFGAPVIAGSKGDLHLRLQSLLPYVIDARQVWNAFTGYAHNQWRKMEVDKYNGNGSVDTWTKFGTAAARVLRQGTLLLQTGQMFVPLPEFERLAVMKFRDRMRNDSTNRLTIGQVLDSLERQKMGFWQAYEDNADRWKPDESKINEFLLEVREEFWYR